MVTINDIAQKLGLSTSTVSRALTDASGVSLQTRERVKKAAEEMNYSVNRFAQNLVTRRSDKIGFMIPDISDSFFAKSAYGVEEALHSTPYSLAYTNVKRNSEKVCDYLRQAEEYCYAGAFVTIDDWTDGVCAMLRSMRIPVISLRRKPPKALQDRIPYVDSDHLGATESIVSHLMQLGHQTIGYIGFDTPVGQERARNFRTVAEKHGLQYYEISNISYHNANIRISVGYHSARKLLDEHQNITAIYAGDDQIALGVLQYLDEMHVSVPQELSVVGYDDRDTARLYCVQLTTVRQQLFEIGEYAGGMMLKMIEDPQAKISGMRVPTLLQRRRTTGPARV